ncbi:MAG: hypothetical protein WD603_03525 [Patescibacteria group bacterium]
MRKLSGSDFDAIKPFFDAAAEAAQHATCRKARCGAVVVKDGRIVASGYNSPPLEKEANRMCDGEYPAGRKPAYCRTCCVHAEWRAILNACKQGPAGIEGSILYFMRIDENGDFTEAGEPFCTVCSRLALEAGITIFALWNADGAYLYDAEEYNRKSYEFFEQPA